MLLLQVSVFIKLIQPQNLLAILGGAVLGWFVVHALTAVSFRWVGTKAVPQAVLFLLRLGGAVVAGWVVALMILGVGGGGFGGSGGGKFGEGTGNPFDPGKKDEQPVEKDREKEQPKDNTGNTSERNLYVEVLMDDEIEKAAGPEAVKDRRYYRERGSLPQALLTLKEVREKLSTGQPPYRKLYIVLGKERSDRDVARVRDLANVASGLRLPSDYTAP
jgi:hypothetical protein